MPSETDKQPPSLANSFVTVVTSCCFVMTTVVACHQFAPLAKNWLNAPRHCHCLKCEQHREYGIRSDIVVKIFDAAKDANHNAHRLDRIEELLGCPLPQMKSQPTERPPVTPMPPIAPPLIQMPEI